MFSEETLVNMIDLGIISSTVPTTPLLSMRTEVGHFFNLQMVAMPLKPALSIQDQIALLRTRGMIIDSETTAATFLASNHYYRLNIYFHKLMDSPDHFREGTQFSKVMAIYGNDSWLRNKILTILEPIEVKTRTQVSHYLGGYLRIRCVLSKGCLQK